MLLKKDEKILLEEGESVDIHQMICCTQTKNK